MFRKLLIAVFIGLLFLISNPGKSYSQIDSEAVEILDRMSDIVTDLESCSFELKTEYDIYSEKLGLVKHSDVAGVYLKAPDKMLVNKRGDIGEKNLYYDGKTLTYYSADNNKYGTIPALSTIMETIDSIHNEYGIDFPAADIFYPDLADELIEISDNLSNLGITIVEERKCYHLAGTTEELTYQIWITDDDFLPIKLAIVYTNRIGSPQYEALFLNWNLNPILEDSMFNFKVPDGAVKIKINKKSN